MNRSDLQESLKGMALLVRVTIAVKKHHNLKQAREERIYLSYTFTRSSSLKEVRRITQIRQEPGGRSWF